MRGASPRTAAEARVCLGLTEATAEPAGEGDVSEGTKTAFVACDSGKNRGSMYYRKGAFRDVLEGFGRTAEMKKPLVF